MKLERSSWCILLCLFATACAARSAAPCHGNLTLSSEADLARASSCTSLDGNLTITGSALGNLHGLESLRSVRYLVIAGNPALTSLSGLEGLERADGISVYNNPMLTDVSALSGVRDLGGLVVLDQPRASFGPLAQVTRGELVIENSMPGRDVDFDAF